MDDARLTQSGALAALDFGIFTPRAPWWGGDLQTLRNFIIRSRMRLETYPQERLALPLSDGSGDRLVGSLARPAPASGKRPLVVLIHGLSGCEDSFYVRRSARHLLGLGYSVLRLNLRGAGPSRPLCRLQYHAGRSEDLADALATLPAEFTQGDVVAIGYSLGANMLLKYLGEAGAAAPLKAAISISAPLDLVASSRQLMRWRNAAYQQYLLRSMRAEALAPGADVTPAERRAIREARSIWEFDDRFSAPRNGFRSAEDYYVRNASGRFLDNIAVPTLLIHALDDPWIPASPYMEYDWRTNPNLVVLLTESGGHVGFQGRDRRAAWHDLCTARFLAAVAG